LPPPIGTSGPERFSLLHFRGDYEVHQSLFQIQIGAGGVTFADGAPLLEAIIEQQTITVECDCEPELSIDDVVVTEGDTAVFTVTLSKPSDLLVTVYASTAAGSARSTQDFQPVSNQRITFQPGVTQRQVTVPTIDDPNIEADEFFWVVLSKSDNAILGHGNEGRGTILDNDFASVGFARPASTVGEANVLHPVDVKLTIPGGGILTRDVSVDVADLLIGSAATPADYTYTNPTMVTFVAGSGDGATQQVYLAIVDDHLIEADETVDLQLNNLVDGTGGRVAIDSQQQSHEVTIIDNDLAQVRFSQPASRVPEGTSPHRVYVELVLADGDQLAAPISVDVMDLMSGTATSIADYALLTSTVTFGPGSTHGTTRPANMNIVADNLVEGDETVNLHLHNLAAGAGVKAAIDAGHRDHTVTITDNNFAQVRFSEPASRVAEGTPRHTADVQLVLADDDQLARAISVDVVDLLTGTANPTNDYALLTSKVHFAPGSINGARQPAQLSTADDELVEGDETVDLQLQNLAAGNGMMATIDTDHDDHMVTIVDETPVPVIDQPEIVAPPAATEPETPVAPQPQSDSTSGDSENSQPVEPVTTAPIEPTSERAYWKWLLTSGWETRQGNS
jgi:hypothetical protein